jgi:hypothetical protein
MDAHRLSAKVIATLPLPAVRPRYRRRFRRTAAELAALAVRTGRV